MDDVTAYKKAIQAWYTADVTVPTVDMNYLGENYLKIFTRGANPFLTVPEHLHHKVAGRADVLHQLLDVFVHAKTEPIWEYADRRFDIIAEYESLSNAPPLDKERFP